MNFTDKLDSTLNGDKTYHRFNPKAGLVYTPVKDLSFSFTYSEGIRIPTVSELFAQGPFGSNPNLLPMTSRNFEIGAKGQMGRLAGSHIGPFLHARQKRNSFCRHRSGQFFRHEREYQPHAEERCRVLDSRDITSQWVDGL